MVANTYVLAFAVAFFVLFLAPMLYFTWMGYGTERHSPGSPDDESAP